MMRLLLITLVSSALALGLSSCGKVDGAATPAPTPDPGTGGSGTGSSSNPPAGVVSNSAGFYVRYVRNDNYVYKDHAGSLTPTASCSATQGQLVDCFVEAQELDLYYHGISLQYNVPANLCSYLVVSPYYYYKHSAGIGPNTQEVYTDSNGATGVDLDSDGSVDAGVSPCQYDHTDIQGPNCCAGTYTLTKHTWNSALVPPAYVTTVQSDVPWGGKLANCLSGPAMDTQQKMPSGYPAATIYFVEGTGINGVYAVHAPIKTLLSSDIYAANYYDTSGATPVAIAPGGVVPSTEPYYNFSCLDRTGDFNAQIRVMVRKWNRGTDFTNLVFGNQNFPGSEPAPWASSPWNDYFSWADFASFPGIAE